MNTKSDARKRISAAEKKCTKVQAAWNAAYDSLYGGVAINGHGIYHEQGTVVRKRLLEAQEHIETALKTLDEIDWPTNADYD